MWLTHIDQYFNNTNQHFINLNKNNVFILLINDIRYKWEHGPNS